jgi:hypothetical protein
MNSDHPMEAVEPIRLLLLAVIKMADSLPFIAPQRMRRPGEEKWLDRLYRAGSICFAIRKPSAPHVIASDLAAMAFGQQG